MSEQFADISQLVGIRPESAVEKEVPAETQESETENIEESGEPEQVDAIVKAAAETPLDESLLTAAYSDVKAYVADQQKK